MNFRSLLLTVLLSAIGALRADEPRIGALGRIEPAGGLLQLVGAGDIVASVPVHPNQVVKAGEVLVEFAGRVGAEGDVRLGEIALREAEENAPRLLAARQRSLALAERELDLARDRLGRYEKLTESSIAPQELAARRHAVFAAENGLANLRAELAQARLAAELGDERIRLQLSLARQRLLRAALRAPADGTVVELLAAPGEAGSGVLVRFADLSAMVVVAEVFEVDLPRVKAGARCEITHRVFNQKLAGRVTDIGRIVNAQTKSVRVRIALDEPGPAARFLGLEVNVAIVP